MKIEEKTKVSVEVEHLKNMKCDICFKNFLKKNKTDSRGGSLIGFKLDTDHEGKCFVDQNESSDFCEKCYDELISYLRTEKKAKIPSYYFNIELVDSREDDQEDSRH